VIASQATISGAFSMAQQATLLGMSPRVRILHTSSSEFGQIYVPAVNWLQLAGVLGIVLGFRTGPEIASAYGIAVTGTMLVTTLLVFTLAVRGWKWSWLVALPVFALLLTVDTALFAANLAKFLQGGWVPLAIGGLLFVAMWTWYRGRRAVARRIRERTLPMDTLLATIEPHRLHRTPGTAIYLTTFSDGGSGTLMQNLRHNGVLHAHVVLLTIETVEDPVVPAAQRLEVADLGDGVWRAVLRYGFMDRPNVGQDVAPLAAQGISLDPVHTSFFIGHNNIVGGPQPLLPTWQRRLFFALGRLAASPSEYLGLPAEQTVELGSRIEV
jgi:KUP system potassium uptake protein